jgi:hypothetical protein
LSKFQFSFKNMRFEKTVLCVLKTQFPKDSFFAISFRITLFIYEGSTTNALLNSKREYFSLWQEYVFN